MINAGTVIDMVIGKHELQFSHGEGHKWRSEGEQEITQLVSSELSSSHFHNEESEH